MTHRWERVVWGAIVCAAIAAPAFGQMPAPAAAQTSAAPAAVPRVVFDAGFSGVGGGTQGTSTIVYTAPDASAVPQYSIARSQAFGSGIGARLQFRVTNRAAIEVSGRWTRPTLNARITGDTDGAADTTASNRLHQFMVGSALRVDVAPRGRLRPFVLGGAGWLGQLSEDVSTIGNGWFVEIGGGAQYLFRPRAGHFRPYALRGDVTLNVRAGGLDFSEHKRLAAPAMGLSFVIRL